MNCLTWQKFQGAWLSSVIVALRQSSEGRKYCTCANWLSIRKEIATYIVESPRLDISSLKKLEQFLSMADQDKVGQDSAAFQFNQAISSNQEKLVKNENIILCLLPLTIFYANDQEKFQELLDNCVLKSLITSEEQEDILIWNCLLASSFNPNQNGDVDQRIRQVLNRVKVKESDLPNKLEIVIRAWKKGSGLYQLAEELNSLGNQSQIAIALAAYCFTATPRHFELAVKRAENVSLSGNFIITALTATLSGAYNGVAGIPWNWRAIAHNQRTYQSESKLATHLFKVWLGIYSPASLVSSYNEGLDAVAQVTAIQTRQSLRIISQNNT